MKRATALLLSCLVAAPAAAATFVVDITSDEPDQAPGDGICDSTRATSCTLRAAIQEANGLPGLDYIDFAVGESTLVPLTPYPLITDDVVIDGTTSPGYSETGNSPLWRSPAVFLDGVFVSGDTTDGLRARGSSAEPVRVEIYGLGIVRFPGDGIDVNFGSSAVLDANWIGIGRAGAASGNSANGVVLTACEGCIVGAFALELLGVPVEVGLGNAIAANGDAGILIGLGSNNIVGGNEVGALRGRAENVFNPGGGNGGVGISVLESGTRVGQWLTPTVETHNIVVFNAGHGIAVAGHGNTLERNFVSRNGGDGIRVTGDDHVIRSDHFVGSNGGAGVRLGTADAAADRARLLDAVIHDHDRGVVAHDGSGVLIEGNDIDAASVAAMEVSAAGAAIHGNVIGGADIASTLPIVAGIVVTASDVNVFGNTVLGVDGDAIRIDGPLAKLEYNLVGVDQDGGLLGNETGIRVTGADAELRFNNVVASTGDGVRIEASGALVCVNAIGLLEDGTPGGNGFEGIRVLGHDNFIGRYPPAPEYCGGNWIANNRSDGIQVHGLRNLVGDNLVEGQVRGGILLAGTAGETLVHGNVLVGNGAASVRVGSTGRFNRIEDNIFGSTGLDIDLADDGTTTNDSGDADLGPNDLLNHPEIVAVFGGRTGYVDVTYRMDVATGNAAYPLQVDFYLHDAALDRHGRLHSDSYDLPRNVQRTVRVVLPAGVAAGTLLAMAIDADGNSSEMGPPVAFSTVPAGVDVFTDGFED